MIGEFVAHYSSPQFGSLNHSDLVRCNASRQTRVGRLRAEADIRPPTIPVEAVENDPTETYAGSGVAAETDLTSIPLRTFLGVIGEKLARDPANLNFITGIESAMSSCAQQ